jgi:uncharacterized NAD(P)/FAD-binding protein YdhS
MDNISQNNNTEIAIVGVGFSGLMTAIHLLKNVEAPLTLHLINDTYDFGKGPAYSTKSIKHLLNVPTAKMSCFKDKPDHFLEWAHSLPKYMGHTRDLLGRSFLPRQEFGQYLMDTWQKTLAAKRKDSIVNTITSQVTEISKKANKYLIHTNTSNTITVDYTILSIGHETPQNLPIENMAFYSSPLYIGNPWLEAAVRNIDPHQDILILGNGLTMVDTILSVMDSGYSGKIHTISPQGFAVLPHRFNYLPYEALTKEIKAPYELNELFALISKHVRLVGRLGYSPDPVIDSLRPMTQEMWAGLSEDDQRRFMRSVMPIWNKLRHRMAGHIYDYITGLRLKGQLLTCKGRFLNATENGKSITATILRKGDNTPLAISVGRMINCTGPDPDITRSANPLLRSLIAKGMIQPDKLKIGLAATDRWTLMGADGKEDERLYTLGVNLRGKYWESTAVPELRVQAEKLAKQVLTGINTPQMAS